MGAKNIVSLMLALVVSLMVPNLALAGPNSWYWGKIEHVKLTSSDSGNFFVRLEDGVISHCKWNRVYFTTDNLGEGRKKLAFSMAMSASATGQEFGIVTKGRNHHVSGEVCHAAGQTAGVR